MKKITDVDSFTFRSLSFDDPSLELVDYSVIKDFKDNTLYTTTRKYLDDYFSVLKLINSKFINQLSSLNADYAISLYNDHMKSLKTDQSVVLLSSKKYLVCSTTQATTLSSIIGHMSDLDDTYEVYANHNNHGYFSSDAYLIKRRSDVLGMIIDLPHDTIQLYTGYLQDDLLYMTFDGSLQLSDESTSQYVWSVFDESHTNQGIVSAFDSFIDSEVLSVDYQGIRVARKSLLSDDEKVKLADLTRSELLERSSGRTVRSLMSTITTSLFDNEPTTLNDYNKVVNQLMSNYS